MILPLTAKEVRTSVFCLRAANFAGRERTFVAQFCRAFNCPVGRRNTSVGINPTRTELAETGGTGTCYISRRTLTITTPTKTAPPPIRTHLSVNLRLLHE